ncbi:unnamed protein product [Diamesa hyperborea]
MTNSYGSVLDGETPTTPTDSGVQLLDSESDLNESMISSSGFEFEACADVPGTSTVGPPDITSSICDASMISSTHSTFDAENTEIVYRRRVKKPSKAAPKKRVSFHEDILKNTRTDNIHIEHGFVTYKGKNVKPKNTRYSWCSEYDNEGFEDDHDDNSQYVYRNACSEVLDYGKTTDVLDEEEGTYTKYDNSGVFEYGSSQNPANNRFYKCSCSSSNSKRGVPEGSEDLNTVTECIPSENNDYDFTILHKPCGKSNTTKNPKLSKSLDATTQNDSNSSRYDYLKMIGEETGKKSRHLSSPLRKKRSDHPSVSGRMSPDLFNSMGPSKTSLINRFLRNVTQKKILEATIKKNNFFQAKLKNERKLFGGNLYVKGVKPKDDSLIKDLNAEIAMEIEMGSNSFELNDDQDDMMASYSVKKDFRFDGGVGEVRAEMFDVSNLQLLRSKSEILMKVYKLYTGYSNDGHMVPVLVFLTDQTLYVIDLVRNKLCNKFVLPYSELDVILMGPYGNTVLLSNNARDMQQVLLAGGPYPADKLVSSLELCARRGGSILPAVGQLTLDHLAPLRSFVCSNSSISKDDAWKYYAVVNIPAGSLGVEQEPLGPNLQGPLMHRSLSHSGVVQQWSAGYFLLKAGVLYLFNDSTQKIPNWAVSLIKECQGARRCLHTNRPHCFEILLRTGSLQLAAPDEYVASDWLQSLVQSASGLFEMQERHKTLGCTLIMTSNHLITLREDFSSPLRRTVLTSAAIEDMTCIKIPGDSNSWWCTLEFECQEVRENSDDLVIFFATSSELQRFLMMLEDLWHSKKDTPFPVIVVANEDEIVEHCTKLFSELHHSWDPLLTASLGYPQ